MPRQTKTQIPLEIAHILFLDIVGYSKFSINEQRAVVDELADIVRASDEFKRADAAGRLIKIPTGDGMALVFYTSPDSPVQCAVEIDRALKQNPRMQLRMGVHSGPVSGVIDVNGHANLAGAGLNIAQRVMDCGDAGHILLSKHVAEDLEEYEQWRPLLRELGVCHVKHGIRVAIVNLQGDQVGNPDVPRRFRLLRQRSARMRWGILAGAALLLAAISALVLISRRSTRSTSTIPEKSIAVLPFENRSSDKENAYFAEGIQDEIITRLSKIADLEVISQTSTQHYKSAPEHLSEIASQLGVAHIVEGSVQKSGDAVRVNVQLIKAANGSHIWAEIFDRKLTDIFLVESDVAKAIADQLQAKLTGQERQIIAAKPTDNPAAYDAYLRGLAYSRKSTITIVNTVNAQRYLREAVRLDPKFATAWALLSSIDSLGYGTNILQPTVALKEEALQAAETALRLQPNLGEALMAKGDCYYWLRDYDNAVHYYEQARLFLPNSSRIPESLAYVARRRAQWDVSESLIKEAERLDPRNVFVMTQHVSSFTLRRRFSEALQKLDQILDIVPDDLDTLVTKASVFQAEGDLPRAAQILAPLHPGADDTSALETQIYQAILERKPAAIIPRLKEILAKPDPALGFYNGELRFWLGWAQQVAGDQAAARESWRQARTELEPFLADQPNNIILIADLALTNAGLGDKAAALALSEQAVAATPLGKDALSGFIAIEVLARVTAQTGEPDRAIAALQQLLSRPGASVLAASAPLTPAILRLDPMFDLLRKDARFQKLCQEKQS
jgi:TolB-like protein/class 3 adenylate cyclase/Tfp pilus assembly protein PilF